MLTKKQNDAKIKISKNYDVKQLNFIIMKKRKNKHRYKKRKDFFGRSEVAFVMRASPAELADYTRSYGLCFRAEMALFRKLADNEDISVLKEYVGSHKVFELNEHLLLYMHDDIFRAYIEQHELSPSTERELALMAAPEKLKAYAEKYAHRLRESSMEELQMRPEGREIVQKYNLQRLS